MRNEFGAAGLALLAMIVAAHADVLITPREAKLPDADKRDRGPMAGPRVLLVAPLRDAKSIKSPFSLEIRFEPRDGAPIDLNTLVVTYEKSPPVDLTERLKPYLSPTGIAMPQAETPPGEHRLHIEIKDVLGRVGGTEFAIDAAP